MRVRALAFGRLRWWWQVWISPLQGTDDRLGVELNERAIVLEQFQNWRFGHSICPLREANGGVQGPFWNRIKLALSQDLFFPLHAHDDFG